MLESIRAFFESLAGMILLVFFGLLIFSAAMIVCALKMPGNDRVYLFLVGTAGNFSGSLFTILHVRSESVQAQPPIQEIRAADLEAHHREPAERALAAPTEAHIP